VRFVRIFVGLAQRGRRTGVEPLNFVIHSHYAASSLRYLDRPVAVCNSLYIIMKARSGFLVLDDLES